jgi:hypothetical protein
MLSKPADGSLEGHEARHTQGQAGHQNTEHIVLEPSSTSADGFDVTPLS